MALELDYEYEKLGVASDNSGNDVDEIIPCTFRFIAP
jgi:hypothetical protein